MVFQSYALFPHLSVAENIMFGLKVRRVKRGERQARLRRAADLLGLEQLLDRKPSQLSGGQQQRVALGRALVAQAPVCLMDEPLSNLDAQLRSEMRREIRALQRRLGITMVYVTHDQVEAMTMADRVILMRAGKIEQNGSPADAIRAPADRLRRALRRIAADERAAGGDAGRTRRARGRSAGATRPCNNGSRACVPNACGLPRPACQSGSLRSSISAPAVRSRRGRESRTSCCERRATLTVAPGEPIHLEWSPADAHWFDASSQCRIA